MNLNAQSSSPDSPHAKPSFPKRSNYGAGRKYRRHSPMSESSSSDGSPRRGQSPSPALPREDAAKASDNRWKRKNGERELDRDSGRSRSEKGGGESYRYSEKQSSGSSHHHRKHDDYSRHHRYADEGERGYNRSSYSGRDSRGGTLSDNRRRESEHGRSRDKPLSKEFINEDKDRDSAALEHQKRKDISDRGTSGRGRSDSNVGEIKTGEHNSHKRSLANYRGCDTFSNEESRGHGKQSSSSRAVGGGQTKETRNSKELLEQDRHAEKKKHGHVEPDRHIDRYKREHDKSYNRSSSNFRKGDWTKEEKEDETRHADEDHNSLAKKLKMVNSGCSSSKSTSKADEMLPSSVKQFQETAPAVSLGHAQTSLNEAEGAQDLNAAKVAALKAAELVNLNLKGSGYMSTDQKKKLLWGNKKNVAAEESGNRWDASLFPDKERQEKFYKLMSLRLPWYLWPNVGCEGRREDRAEAGRQRRQWCPPSREATGAPDGFRETVHCWTPPKRWPHRWSWSVILIFPSFCTLNIAQQHFGGTMFILKCLLDRVFVT